MNVVRPSLLKKYTLGFVLNVESAGVNNVQSLLAASLSVLLNLSIIVGVVIFFVVISEVIGNFYIWRRHKKFESLKSKPYVPEKL